MSLSRCFGCNDPLERFSAVSRKGFNQFSKSGEQVARIMRSRRRLRMVLHGKKWHSRSLQTLDGVVVQIEMRQYRASLQRFVVDREAVVLRRDLDPPRAEIHHRMICAMMPEIEFVGLAAERQPQQLMPEADAEYRLLAQNARDGSVSVRQRRGVAGSVRQENTVGIVREYLFRS